MSPRLVLVASFPKSGNTWTRLVLEHLLRGAGEPVPINDVRNGLYADRRRLFDLLGPVEAADLATGEIELFLPDIYRQLNREAQSGGPLVVKTHELCRRCGSGEWLFPPEAVRAVLHLVRHPFDVAASYAHHLGVGFAEAAAMLCDPAHRIAEPATGLPEPLVETAGSWSGHALAWAGHPAYAVATHRYEDMLADPVGSFLAMARAAGLRATAAEVARAVDLCRFERLQAEERQAGFRERPRSSPAFFRSGRNGSGWRDADPALLERLAAAAAPAMARFGYRPDGGWAPA